MRKAMGLELAAVALAASGCGATAAHKGSKPTPAASGQNSIGAAARAYLADADAVNAVRDAFTKAAAAWGPSETGAEALAAAQPYVAALPAFQVMIQEAAWPVSVRADMRSLADATALQVGALQTVGTLNLFDEGPWLRQMTTADAASSAAVGAVRHDLGLPPAPGATPTS